MTRKRGGDFLKVEEKHVQFRRFSCSHTVRMVLNKIKKKDTNQFLSLRPLVLEDSMIH